MGYKGHVLAARPLHTKIIAERGPSIFDIVVAQHRRYLRAHGPAKKHVVENFSETIDLGWTTIYAHNPETIVSDPQGRFLSVRSWKELRYTLLTEPLTMMINDSPVLLPEGSVIWFNKNRLPTIIYSPVPLNITIKGTTHTFADSQNNTIVLHENGNIEVGNLSAPARLSLGERTFNALPGSRLHFDKKGSITGGQDHSGYTVLKIDTEQDLVVGMNNFHGTGPVDVVFHENFTISSITFYEPVSAKVGDRWTTFGELSGTYTTLSFHSNGAVARGWLGMNSLFQVGDHRIPVKKGTLLAFNEVGELNLDEELKLSRHTAFRIKRTERRKGMLYELLDVFIPFAVMDSDIPTGEEVVLARANSRVQIYNKSKRIAAVSLAYTATLPVQGKSVAFVRKYWSNDYYTPDLTFHENGMVKYGILKSDTLLTVGRYEILFAAKSEIRFTPEGDIETGAFKGRTVLLIGGRSIPFDMSTSDDRGATFSKNGALLEGDLHENVTLRIGPNTITFAPQLDDKGCSVRDIDPRDGYGHAYDLYFYENGEIKRGALHEDTPLVVGSNTVIAASRCESGYTYRTYEYEHVSFHPNGEIKSCVLAQDCLFEHHGTLLTLAGGHSVSFYENGALRSCHLKEPATIGEGKDAIALAPNDDWHATEFYPDGRLKKGKLYKSLTKEGMRFAAGTWLDVEELLKEAERIRSRLSDLSKSPEKE